MFLKTYQEKLENTGNHKTVQSTKILLVPPKYEISCGTLQEC